MASLPTECLLSVTVHKQMPLNRLLLLPYATGSMLPGYTIWPYNQSKNKCIVIALNLE